MRLKLRTKLVGSFVAVIAVTGSIGTGVAVYLIGQKTTREAQDRVASDLKSARQIYDQRLRDVQTTLEFTALRRCGVINPLREGERDLLLQALQEALHKGDLDTLSLIDETGRVVARAHNPAVFGDRQDHNQLVRAVLEEREAIRGTQIVGREELLNESEELAARAQIRPVETPRAKRFASTRGTSGMMLQAAVPIIDDDSTFLGVLHGGILLNRDHEIVDRTRDLVFQAERYHGTYVGTSTIFQDDLRISTNVMLATGQRAIGTRLSSEVYDRVIAQGESWTARAFVVNDWYITAYEPIRDVDDQVIGALYVGLLEKKYADIKHRTLLLLASLTVAGMVLASVIGYMLAGAVTRPIHRLKEGAEAIAAGCYDCTIQVTANDEIGLLAESFNRLARELERTYGLLHGRIEAADKELKQANQELRDKQAQLVHAEKLAALGALAAGIAHEINNPLGTISLYAQMTADELGDGHEELAENMDVILRHSTRAGQIVKNLLEYARHTELEVGPVEVNPVLADVLAMTTHQATLQQVAVTSDLTDDLPAIVGDREKLRQVFLNVVVNALQAMPDGGQLSVSSRRAPDGSGVEVRIGDSGCGIPAEQLGKVFDPFFTTKETGKGTGLGLSVSHGIVEQHRGVFTVESEPGLGTTFTVTIPTGPEEERPGS